MALNYLIILPCSARSTARPPREERRSCSSCFQTTLGKAASVHHCRSISQFEYKNRLRHSPLRSHLPHNVNKKLGQGCASIQSYILIPYERYLVLYFCMFILLFAGGARTYICRRPAPSKDHSDGSGSSRSTRTFHWPGAHSPCDGSYPHGTSTRPTCTFAQGSTRPSGPHWQ